MPDQLRAAIVVDYQNVHLVGHHAFGSSRTLRPHETLVDPLPEPVSCRKRPGDGLPNSEWLNQDEHGRCDEGFGAGRTLQSCHLR